jgi:hypothetical protein
LTTWIGLNQSIARLTPSAHETVHLKWHKSLDFAVIKNHTVRFIADQRTGVPPSQAASQLEGI